MEIAPVDPASVLKKTSSAYMSNDPRPDFMEEMCSHGFTVPPTPEIGHIVRVQGPGDKGKQKSGWYIFQEVADGYKSGATIGIGVFGSWKGNPEKITWLSKKTESMSIEERAVMNERLKAAQIARDEDKKQRHDEASAKAQAIVKNATPTKDHPYQIKKQIKTDVLVVDGSIVVPVSDVSGIVSVQFIKPNGFKKCMTGGKTKGCWHHIEGGTETIYVVEGYATGMSVHEATGATVYVTFGTSGLMDVANTAKAYHPGASLVIAGDEDTWTDGNPGRSKATAAASVVMCRTIFPEFKDVSTKPTDFNDLHCLNGIDAVKAQLDATPELYQHKVEYDSMPSNLLAAPGILGDIAAYYNATARAPQPGFAIQTAIAIASVVLGRNYRTTKGNHTSLYFLNVAKSGTGKEHAKTVIEEILTEADQEHLLNGAGYTSAGAVMSTLMRQPRHITVIDEFGRYLEAAKGRSNTNLMEANTQIMEAIGRCHGTIRPTSYSTMTLTKEKAAEHAARKIRNPAITLLGMTTPQALYSNLDSSHVADGFLGRFIIHQSNQPRMVHDDKDLINVPNKINEWINRVTIRADHQNGDNISSQEPHFETIPFSGEAMGILREFDQQRVDLTNALEKFNLEALPGRSKELAMRMSLIVALATNPNATVISATDALWGMYYIKFALEQTVEVFKKHVSGSEYEQHKKDIMNSIRTANSNGVTWREMQKTPPFSMHKRRDLTDLLGALVDGGFIALQSVQTGGRGRPREAYVGLK